ncbi:dihydrofolate reductase family protein [Nocardioides jiangxiensis]|uniref:Dihydrofolate reductase family protein n=1 Tax=Nocardioides jiangxiensis TaxID=3064524 RepID=A0ABT9AYK0_9ACTN|nr:dihydrofolate reductase family protein [Nocardioides sp. WY-20]MDO7867657.1 dihydrofolate reductase family protein [Nocardioides sp. WY-20]
MATIYYTGASLDGFIATPDHDLSWLVTRALDPAGPMHYEAFAAGVGALVMGASTYQWLLDHLDEVGGAWPYEQPTWVLTHREFGEPPGRVTFTDAPVTEVHRAAREAAGEGTIWLVGGGDLVGQFFDARLLDEVWVQLAPVTLGAGHPLLPRRVELELLEVARNRDFACVRYAVATDGGG